MNHDSEDVIEQQLNMFARVVTSAKYRGMEGVVEDLAFMEPDEIRVLAGAAVFAGVASMAARLSGVDSEEAETIAHNISGPVLGALLPRSANEESLFRSVREDMADRTALGFEEMLRDSTE